MNDWQPIETAKRDRIIILHAPTEHVSVAVGYWEHGGNAWMMLSDDGNFAEAEPTEWQLMPEPPETL